MLLNVNMNDQNEVENARIDVENHINELNQIIDEIVIAEIGIDIWKTIVLYLQIQLHLITKHLIVDLCDNDNETNNNQTPR